MGMAIVLVHRVVLDINYNDVCWLKKKDRKQYTMETQNNQSKAKKKKAGVVILITGKVDVIVKDITRDKERYYTMIKGLNH